MNVTINVDASHNSDHKVGAFAFWIVCNKGKIRQCGPVKEAADCLDAEMAGIGNAFHALLKADYITGVTRVYLNCDSIPAMHHIFNQKVKKRRPMALEVQKVVAKVAAKYGLAGVKEWVICAHVKAHSGKETKRKWVNDWCDKNARQQMQKLLINKMLKQ